jgi:hypothetical protein
MHFVADGGLALWFLDPPTLDRAFELMHQYADHPMDLADASLVVMAEAENLHKIFAIDRRDFSSYGSSEARVHEDNQPRRRTRATRPERRLQRARS